MKNQGLPLILTTITAAVLSFFLWVEIRTLNAFTFSDIVLRIRWIDVVIGLTIYLKTSIDFAIFIGRLMRTYPTWKDRIAIEIGTALGNAAGTMLILLVWTFFREVEWLLALMIFVAALVLFRLAEDGLEHAIDSDTKYPPWYRNLVWLVEKCLKKLNHFTAPVLRYIVPEMKPNTSAKRSFWPLLGFAFVIPFVLGLDDFAGYVSLFNVVNVFGFSIGVFLGHMLLTICLYIKPEATIRLVKNSIVSLIGSLFFIGLALWGLVEVARMLLG